MPFIFEVESIFIQRFYTGLITLRNQLLTPIRTMGRRIIELYDALLTGNDWEVTPVLSLKRRAGHTLYKALTYPAQIMYSWKSNTQGTIPIFGTTQDVEYVDPNSGTVTQISANPSGTAQSSIMGIGNFLYIGNPNFNYKWDGPSGAQGKTNWGIAIGSVNNATGPNTAGNGANGGGAGTAWTNPNNVTSAVSFASVTLPATGNFSQGLNATQFAFSIPSVNSIAGIAVTFDYNAPSTNVQLLKNGSATGQIKLASSVAGTTTITLGGATDLWQTTWVPNDINQTTFGVQFTATNITVPSPGHSQTWQIRNVKITIYGVGGPTVTVNASAGSFSAVNGYSYVFAYGNSYSGEISNATPISVNTGAFTNKLNVQIALTASTDTQVNQIRLYRTTDTGGGNIFFELPTSPYPNTTATVNDTAADTSLQVTSQAEINLGNTPPPVGLTNLEWFAGRMWGSVNNLLYASTGAETIAGTAPNSNWNPAFQYLIPQPIIRNVRWTNGLLVFTVDDCYIVRGTDIPNFTVNEFVKDLGLRSYNALDTDGTNIYIFTSDRQFLTISPSGIDETGQAIADQLLTIDPTACYVKVLRYGLDSIVRILDTVNNLYFDYNLRQQCWNLPGILKMPGCTAAGTIEVSPGVWRLLLSSNNSGTVSLAYRDITNFQDLGTSYAPNAVFGTINLADPGTLAKFGARGGMVLETTSAGTQPTLSVLPNDAGVTLSNAIGSQITGNFVSLSVPPNPVTGPPTLGQQAVNYRSSFFYWLVAKSLSAFCHCIQFQVSAPAENTATELIGFGIFGDQKQESTAPGQLPQVQGR